MAIDLIKDSLIIDKAQRSNPYLYILMRTDMESMNPGKAVAQGAHAANQFVHEMGTLATGGNGLLSVNEKLNLLMFENWEASTPHGFGVTITLEVNLDWLELITQSAKTAGHISQVTLDPSYPLRDGDFLHLIPVITCGYIFGDKEKLKVLLSQFNLHP